MDSLNLSQVDDKLRRGLASLDLPLSDQQITQLTGYLQLIHKWNQAYNLTSVRDPLDMVGKHLLDSLVVAPMISGQHFIDVGTGPGLPGVPLAIALPDCQFVLLDSLGKRIRFIQQACYQLGINNVTAVQSRVEDYISTQPFCGVLSRAFASLEDMLTWCHHLTDEAGYFWALKGQLPTSELAQLPAGFALVSSQAYRVPQVTGERHLLQIRKTNG